MTVFSPDEPVIGAAVAPSTPALAARAEKKSAFLWGVAALVSEPDQATNSGAGCHHLPEAIGRFDQAIASGTPVHGYLHWRLLDKLEKAAGYAPRFSLVAVHHPTFVRALEPRLDASDSLPCDVRSGHRWA